MPAAWGLARLAVWSVAHHTLSLYDPDPAFLHAFQGLYKFLSRGPRNCLPYGVAVHLRQLGWKTAPPSLSGFSMRLKLFTLIRLGHVDLPSLWHNMREAHLHLDAALLPLSKMWLEQSAVAALMEVERRAILGNLVNRRDGSLLPRTCLREVLYSHAAREKLLYTWLSAHGNPLADGQEIIRSWLARRIAWHPMWDSNRNMLRILGLLSRVVRLCPLKAANAFLRLVANGVVLSTRNPGEITCILSRSCYGSHMHGHYLGSMCWATHRILRRCAQVLPLDQYMVRSSLSDADVKKLGSIAYHLVRAINVSRSLNSDDRSEAPVEHSLLYS